MWSSLSQSVQDLVSETGVPVKVAHVDSEADQTIFPEQNLIVTGVVESDGEFLFVNSKKTGRNWEFPSGRPEDDETLSEAVSREVHEETGFAVKTVDPSIVLVWTLPERTISQVVFEVDVDVDSEGTTEDDDEIDDVAWFDSLPETLTFGDPGVETHCVILEQLEEEENDAIWSELVDVADRSDRERKVAVGAAAFGVAAALARRAFR